MMRGSKPVEILRVKTTEAGRRAPSSSGARVFRDGERRLDNYEVCYTTAAKRLGGPRRGSKGIHLEREPKRALGIGGALSGISLPRGRDKVVLWNSVPP